MPPARRSPQPTVPWEAWQESIVALTAGGQLDEAALTIERALDDGQDASELLALLRRVEASAPLGDAGLRLKVRLHGNVPRPGDLLALVQELHAGGVDAPYLHAYLAWALAQHEHFSEALDAAGEALRGRADLTPRELALALRTQGFALNRVSPDSDWAAPFEEALAVSEGWARGLVLLDLAGLHSRAGHEGRALLVYADALGVVVSAWHRALVLNNMGLVCLRSGRFAEAEEYFTQVARLRSGFRSRALSGLAAARRALGEWARAESLYLQAAAVAGDDEDDLRQARRGVGHTQRLAGRVMPALDTLREAARTTASDAASGQSWVNVDLAAALVSLDGLDPVSVEEALAHTGPLDREDAERAVIVRAELARRTGDAAQAVALLSPLERTTLWLREEAHAFPQLFALLPTAARPEPLPRPRQTHVHLKALGVPAAQVNGRVVRLGPLEVVSLAALLLSGGTLTTDELTEVIRDETPRNARQAAKRVSVVVRQLRQALGWPGSVLSGRGAYHLDPETRWTSDIQTALALRQNITAFLTGIHLPWATEQEQYLMQRDSDLLP